MESFKNRIKTLGPGIFLVLATLLFAIVSLILYGVGVANAGGYQHVGSMVCYILIIVVDIVLFFLMKASFIPACNTILSAVSIGCFVLQAYNYVAAVYTGVDLTSFNTDFIFSIIFYLLTYAASVASIFVPVVRDSADEETVEVEEEQEPVKE